MSKIFIDTEFLEGTQRTFFGKSKPTIDLISIALVSEDGREFYAISKDFNLKEAWSRYDTQNQAFSGDLRNQFPNGRKQKVYWIRENVLKPIWKELSSRYLSETTGISGKRTYSRLVYSRFSYNSLAGLIGIYGKTNKQIAEEVCLFIDARYIDELDHSKGFMYPGGTSVKEVKTTNVEFYGYYCDYDWCVFCWLFGKMIDLPKGFPMYCRDLKQTLDEKQKIHGRDRDGREIDLKKTGRYPKQTNEHNALDDARWTLKLHKFLEQL